MENSPDASASNLRAKAGFTLAEVMVGVQIQVSWQSGNLTRERQMTTFVAQYGMQKYIY